MLNKNIHKIGKVKSGAINAKKHATPPKHHDEKPFGPTASNDKLTGTAKADSISGLAGNDSITGLGNNDTLSGDAGNDTLKGGAGGDSLLGGVGNDNVSGDDGNDSLWGGAGNDNMTGSSGEDELRGEDGNDLLNGGADNDYADGGNGADTLLGDSGDDTLNGSTGNDSLNGGSGNDTYIFGDDAGTDILADSAGTDTIDMLFATGAATINLVNGTLNAGSYSATITGTIENLVGGSNDDVFVGTDEADHRFEGNAGSDLLQGADGDDTLLGGANNDSLSGNDGEDSLDGGLGNDNLAGGADNDNLSGGAGNDTQYGGTGNDTLDAGDTGYDELHGGDGNDSLDATDAYYVYAYGDEGNDTITGGEGADYIYGGDGNDSLNGGINDDYIEGGAGADTMVGGDGYDTFVLGEGEWAEDSIDGGGLTDELQLYALEHAVTVNLVDQSLTDGTDSITFTSIESIVGTYLNDSITGNTDHNYLHGGDGDDTLYGGGGNDTLRSGEGTDVLYGEDGNDTLNADEDSYSVTLDGGSGNDTFSIDEETTGTIVISDSSGTDTIDLENQSYGVSLSLGDGVINSYTQFEEFDVYSRDSNLQAPKVAALNNGNAVVVWQSDQSEGNDIYFRLFNGFGRDASEGTGRVNYDARSGEQYNASVAALDGMDEEEGRFLVTWTSDADDDESGTGIFGRILNRWGESEGDAFQINNVETGNQDHSASLGLDGGGFVVTWDDGSDVFARIFDAEGAGDADFMINSYNSGVQQNAQVARVDASHFVVVWESAGQDGDGIGIFGQLFNLDGSLFGDEFKVNSTTTGDQSQPSIVGMADGGFVVVWTSDDHIIGRQYGDDGTALGSEFVINSYTGASTSNPSVTALSNGGFAVSWQVAGADGDGAGIFGQNFAADGTPNSSEYHINTTTEDDQTAPSNAGLSNGTVFTVWESPYDDENAIVGQYLDSTGDDDFTQQIASFTPGEIEQFVLTESDDRTYFGFTTSDCTVDGSYGDDTFYLKDSLDGDDIMIYGSQGEDTIVFGHSSPGAVGLDVYYGLADGEDGENSPHLYGTLTNNGHTVDFWTIENFAKFEYDTSADTINIGADVNNVSFSTAGGDDAFNLTDSLNNYNITIDAGAGNDTLDINYDDLHYVYAFSEDGDELVDSLYIVFAEGYNVLLLNFFNNTQDYSFYQDNDEGVDSLDILSTYGTGVMESIVFNDETYSSTDIASMNLAPV